MVGSQDEITIIAAEKHWAMGELGPCLIVIWRGAATEAAVLQVNEAIWNLTQKHPANCAFVTIIERNSPTPNAAIRRLAMAGLTRPGKALSCKCAVIEGHEMRSALVRAILTGMALLRREEIPTKFFKSTADMAVWLKNQLNDAGGLDKEILRAAEVVRSQILT